MSKSSKTVFAAPGRFFGVASGDGMPERCSVELVSKERRLLDCWVNKARKKGVQPHAVVAWVRRKIGPDITTWRYTADGSIGCAIPCQQCRRELVRFGLRVTCPLMDHSWFRGFLTDADAPESCPTSGQRAQDPQGVRARRAKVTHKALDRQQRCAGTSCEV